MTTMRSISAPSHMTDLSEARKYFDFATAQLISLGDESIEFPDPDVQIGLRGEETREGIWPEFMYRRIPQRIFFDTVEGVEQSFEVVDRHKFAHASIHPERISPVFSRLVVKVGKLVTARALVEEALGYSLSQSSRPIGVAGFTFQSRSGSFRVVTRDNVVHSKERLVSIPFASGDLGSKSLIFEVLSDGPTLAVYVAFHVLFPVVIESDTPMLVA